MTMTDAADAEPRDIRPVVARRVSNRSAWVFGGMAVLGAIGLFSALEARRAVISSPATSAPVNVSNGLIAPPPDLAIPPSWPQYSEAREMGPPADMSAYAVRPPTPIAQSGRAAGPYRPPESPAYAAPVSAIAPPVSPLAPRPGFAYQAQQSGPSAADAANGAKTGEARATAARFVNPAMTVPQGAVIQAVMETALDSTRAGFARAVVSRDVSSFDGSRVLIPKGSKLFGEYKADLASGQNRALIQWHRLTRPDGAIIDVDSPSADPLGRIGVKGKVNSHFFERFGGAILQSVLDVGVQVAARNVSHDAVIFNLPSSSSTLPIAQDIRPTLKVRQGASVSVFVGRDLDFSTVEQ